MPASPLTLDAFRAEVRRTGSGCTLSKYLAALSPADARVVRDAVLDESIPATAIARVLARKGYDHEGGIITRHRRRGCPDCGMDRWA